MDEEVRKRIEEFRDQLQGETGRNVTLKEASRELFKKLDKNNRELRDVLSDLDLFEL